MGLLLLAGGKGRASAGRRRGGTQSWWPKRGTGVGPVGPQGSKDGRVASLPAQPSTRAGWGPGRATRRVKHGMAAWVGPVGVPGRGGHGHGPWWPEMKRKVASMVLLAGKKKDGSGNDE
jgi:hypothetical protein